MSDAEANGHLIAEVETVAITNQGPVVLLGTDATEFEDRVLPIFISESQALAIQSAILGQMPPRVMTHDLFLNVLNELGGIVSEIIVEELSMNTYFARLHVEVETDGENRELKFDARPSDCIALAVRCNARIRVHRDLMDEAAILRDELHGLEGENGDDGEDEDEFGPGLDPESLR